MPEPGRRVLRWKHEQCRLSAVAATLQTARCADGAGGVGTAGFWRLGAEDEEVGCFGRGLSEAPVSSERRWRRAGESEQAAQAPPPILAKLLQVHHEHSKNAR